MGMVGRIMLPVAKEIKQQLEKNQNVYRTHRLDAVPK